MANKIHPTAVVDSKAEIGDGVIVGPHSYIEAGAVIGDNNEIGSSVWIGSYSRIGNENRIFHGAAIGGPPQDLKFTGENTTLEIGDRNTIREFVTMNRGTSASGKTVVGSDNLIMSYCHIAHDCRVGSHIVLANSTNMGGHVEIHDWAILGGMVPIHQFCRIGAHAMVGTASRIVKDVPPYLLIGADPTRPVGINVIGLERRGFSGETVRNLKELYKIVYRSRLGLAAALEKVRQVLPPIAEIAAFVEFVESTSRGIIK